MARAQRFFFFFFHLFPSSVPRHQRTVQLKMRSMYTCACTAALHRGAQLSRRPRWMRKQETTKRKWREGAGHTWRPTHAGGVKRRASWRQKGRLPRQQAQRDSMKQNNKRPCPRPLPCAAPPLSTAPSGAVERPLGRPAQSQPCRCPLACRRLLSIEGRTGVEHPRCGTYMAQQSANKQTPVPLGAPLWSDDNSLSLSPSVCVCVCVCVSVCV